MRSILCMARRGGAGYSTSRLPVSEDGGAEARSDAEDIRSGLARFVGVDDDAITQPAVEQLAGLRQPMLTARPDRWIGLEPDHLADTTGSLDTLLLATRAG